MRWNPLLNAFGAAAYICAIALLINFIGAIKQNSPDTPIDFAALLSLVVCSAAVMAFLFFYRPLILLSEHKKTEAVSYFLKTLGVFGVITILAFVAVSLI